MLLSKKKSKVTGREFYNDVYVYRLNERTGKYCAVLRHEGIYF